MRNNIRKGKSGFLDVKIGQKCYSRYTWKGWRRRWLVIHGMYNLVTCKMAIKVVCCPEDHAPSRSLEKGYLEHEDKNGSLADSKVSERCMNWLIEDVSSIRRTKSKSKDYAFSLFDKDGEAVVILAGNSETVSQQWISNLHCIIWPPKTSFELQRVFNDLKEVSVIYTNSKDNAWLCGCIGFLSISEEDGISLLNPNSDEIIFNWSLKRIRRFTTVSQKCEDDQNKVFRMEVISNKVKYAVDFFSEQANDIMNSIEIIIDKVAHKMRQKVVPDEIMTLNADNWEPHYQVPHRRKKDSGIEETDCSKRVRNISVRLHSDSIISQYDTLPAARKISQYSSTLSHSCSENSLEEPQDEIESPVGSFMEEEVDEIDGMRHDSGYDQQENIYEDLETCKRYKKDLSKYLGLPHHLERNGNDDSPPLPPREYKTSTSSLPSPREYYFANEKNLDLESPTEDRKNKFQSYILGNDSGSDSPRATPKFQKRSFHGRFLSLDRKALSLSKSSSCNSFDSSSLNSNSSLRSVNDNGRCTRTGSDPLKVKSEQVTPENSTSSLAMSVSSLKLSNDDNLYGTKQKVRACLNIVLKKSSTFSEARGMHKLKRPVVQKHTSLPTMKLDDSLKSSDCNQSGQKLPLNPFEYDMNFKISKQPSRKNNLHSRTEFAIPKLTQKSLQVESSDDTYMAMRPVEDRNETCDRSEIYSLKYSTEKDSLESIVKMASDELQQSGDDIYMQMNGYQSL